jgi:transposase
VSLHSWYQRHPQELPCIGHAVRLHLWVKRFRCLNTTCSQKTFVEQLPDWLPAYARRTTQLTGLLRPVAFEVSAEAAHRLLKHFQVVASGDTLLRIIGQTRLASSRFPRIIGVDDWVLKKGRRYGTVLVDLEQHRPIDWLLERTSMVVAEWLQQHEGLEIVTRDRSTAYSTGLADGAPQAMQVADRWHLLLNLRPMLDRFLGTLYPPLQHLPFSPEHLTLLSQQRPAFRRTRSAQIAAQTRRDKRIAKYEEIQHLRQAGYTIWQIAALLGHHWETVRKYLEATGLPERKQRRPGGSKLAPYVTYLTQRQGEGCENALPLWREIQQPGYSGSPRQVLKWMPLQRTEPAPTTPHPYRDTRPHPARPTDLLPSSQPLAWWLVRDPDQLKTEEVALLQPVCQDGQLSPLYPLAQKFVSGVKQRLADHLDAWLEACETFNPVQVHNFATRLRQDYAAVRAALETVWSNGQTEGQVNRLKCIKRQM